MIRIIGILGVTALAACTASPVEMSYKSVSDGPINYACDNVILIGRVANQSFTHIDDPHDILGHGRVDFDLNVDRVIRGREPRQTIAARSIAHTNIRENVDFLFILKAGADNRYDVITGWVPTPGEAHSRLASRCSM